MIEEIRSGGQTGTDQGFLVAARQLGIKTGGWIPKGFLTEAGPCPPLGDLYGLREHPSSSYPARTRANVRDSDGTAWIGTVGSRGFHCTRNACDAYERPFRAVRSAEELREFILEFNIRILNGAGNRASRNPSAHRTAAEIVLETFKELTGLPYKRISGII